MSLRPEDINPGGDILVGHGLLMTPSLLLDKKVPMDEGRLLDFCSLVNVLTLHDRIITLPADIPEDLGRSRLYNYLRDRGILCELNISFEQFTQGEKLEIEELFGSRITEQTANLVLGSMYDEYNRSIGYSKYDEARTYGSAAPTRSISTQRSKLVDEIIKREPSEWNPGDIPGMLEYELSERYMQSAEQRDDQLQLHLLRTAGYWEISGKYNLPYLPDFMRIPLISSYNVRLSQSLRMFIGMKVDEMVRRELEAAIQIASPLSVPIPPAVSNFLSKYLTSDMEEAFDEMREDFQDNRKAVINWEKEIYEAAEGGGYQKVLEIRNKINASLKALQSEDTSDMKVTVGAALTGDVVDSFLSGGIPTGGVGTYVEQGINLIRTWRQKTRIQFYTTGLKEAAKLEGYNELLNHAFGTSLTKRQIDRFLALTASLERLTRPLDLR